MSNMTRETLAEYAHDAWTGWMKYMFEKGVLLNDKGMTPEPGEPARLMLPTWSVERWQRQMNTEFSALPESEKESDRAEADRMLAIVHGTCMCGCDACKYCAQLLESEATNP